MLCRKCGKEISNSDVCPYCQTATAFTNEPVPAHLQFIYDLMNGQASDPTIDPLEDTQSLETEAVAVVQSVEAETLEVVEAVASEELSDELAADETYAGEEDFYEQQNAKQAVSEKKSSMNKIMIIAVLFCLIVGFAIGFAISRTGGSVPDTQVQTETMSMESADEESI